MFLITLPVLLMFLGLVIDGAHAFGEKRRTQSAADAAALAAAQNLIGGLSSACPAGPPPINNVKKAAECYSEINGGPSSLHQCSDRDASGFPITGAPADTNCYTTPWKGNVNLVEVKLSRTIDEYFLDAIGLGGLLDTVSARAVAGITPLVAPDSTSTTTVTGTTNTGINDPGTTQTITSPGSTNVQTVTTAGDLGGAQAFVMSTSCSAITYNGNPKGATLGAFGTNGGLLFGGGGNKKLLNELAFDSSRCPRPANEPTGSDCPTNAISCIVTRVTLTPPLYWPVPPPPLPTPLPVGTAWNPAAHYGINCILLAAPGTSFTLVTRPAPGVYCVSGAGVTLTINNSMSAGDGYTFVALDGARIVVSSSGTSVRFYWPSACGSRPTIRSGFTCFGRAIADPLTVLYSTNATPTTGNPSCTLVAICFNGSGGSLDGDVFTPLPSNFPPALNQGGGTVYMAGGGAAAGTGFIEAWQLYIEGNSGTYNGNGPAGGSGLSTITTTTPGSTTTVTITGTTTPGTTVAGTTYTTTTPGGTTGSTDPGLDE